MNISYELRVVKEDLREAIRHYENGIYDIAIANLNHIINDAELIKQEILKVAEKEDKDK